MAGIDGRQPEVAKDLVSDTQDNYQFLGRPPVRRLSDTAVAAVYAALGVTLPEEGTKEPVLLSDPR